MSVLAFYGVFFCREAGVGRCWKRTHVTAGMRVRVRRVYQVSQPGHVDAGFCFGKPCFQVCSGAGGGPTCVCQGTNCNHLPTDLADTANSTSLCHPDVYTVSMGT